MTVVLHGFVRQRITGVLGKGKSILRQCMQDTCLYWYREILPRHFTAVARGEYRHQERNKEWLKDKRVIGKGEGRFLDNVMFGRTRMYARQQPRITATSGRGRVILNLPAYATNPGHSNPSAHPVPAREITESSDRDREKLIRFYDKRLEELIVEARLRAAYVTIQF